MEYPLMHVTFPMEQGGGTFIFGPTPEQKNEMFKLIKEGKKDYEAYEIIIKSKDQESTPVKTLREKQIEVMKQYKYLLRKAKAWKAKQSQTNPTIKKNIVQK